MSDSTPLGRILEQHGGYVFEVLDGRLSGSDLTSLMLEVTRRRAGRVDPADVMRRFGSDRFVRPGPVAFGDVRWAEDRMIEAATPAFEMVTLAPLVPTGTHAVVARVDQRRVVSTIRATDVAADPTTGLALEAASRRRELLSSDPRSPEAVHLAGVQRVTRAQRFEGPLSYAHFTLGGLVSAGRDTGNRSFERESIAEHVSVWGRVVAQTALRRAWIQWTSFDPVASTVASTAEQAARSVGLGWRSAGQEESGSDYYRSFRFKLMADVGGEEVDVGDGGDVDWGSSLVGSDKERMVISGLGVERLAVLGRPRDP